MAEEPVTAEEDGESKFSRAVRETYKASVPAYQFVLTILALAGLGWWLDRKLGTDPWLLFAGLALGFTAGIYHLTREVGGKKRQP